MKIRRRKLWLLSLLVVGIAAGWAGMHWMFAEAYCPRLFEVMLYVWAPVVTVLVLLWASFTKNNAPVVQLLSVIGLFAGILFPVALAGSYLSSLPEVQVVYCPPRACDEAEFARSLREAGRLQAAIEAARACLTRVPTSQSEEICLDMCAQELSLSLYEVANPDALPDPNDEDWLMYCEESRAYLEEAHTVAQQYRLVEVIRSIEERQRRVIGTCALPTPTPTPTPYVQPLEIEVLRSQRGNEQAWVDLRVLQGNVLLRDLEANDFSLSANGNSLPFVFESREADDPVCLIAVVDNSGSIAPGITEIRQALELLNDARKPGDELGMVIFGSRWRISVSQTPSEDPLNPTVVDASGGNTALWDAVLVGLETAELCSVDNRYLVVLTDGDDNHSQQLDGDSLTQARELARRAANQGVSICTIGVTSEVTEIEPLRQIAYGCEYAYAENFDGVASLFVQLFGYVRDFYRLQVDLNRIPTGGRILLEVMNASEVTIDFTNRNP